MLKRKYTYLLVAIAFLTGMNNQVSEKATASFEQYIQLNRNSLVYMLNAVSKGSAERIADRKQNKEVSKELYVFKLLSDLLHGNSYVMNQTDYNQIFLFGIVIFVFFANNLLHKNQLWLESLF